MNLIAIGDVILNLDRITALDFDRHQNNAVTVKVFTDSSEPVMTFNISQNAPAVLTEMIAPQFRFQGTRLTR